jgi:hypothetical protein
MDNKVLFNNESMGPRSSFALVGAGFSLRSFISPESRTQAKACAYRREWDGRKTQAEVALNPGRANAARLGACAYLKMLFTHDGRTTQEETAP